MNRRTLLLGGLAAPALYPNNRIGRLLIENEGSCNVGTCQELADLLKLLPGRAVGINWDPQNCLPREKPFPDGYALLASKRLGNVQVKGRGFLAGPQRLDWPAILKALQRDGYRGQIGLETHIFESLIPSSHASMKELIRIVESS